MMRPLRISAIAVALSLLSFVAAHAAATPVCLPGAAYNSSTGKCETQITGSQHICSSNGLSYADQTACDSSCAERETCIRGGDIASVASDFHSCAIKKDGTAWCWGYNYYGQLGDATSTDRTIPIQVSGLTGALSIETGRHFTCAVRSDGTVQCWGYNYYGQLGNGTTANRSVAGPVAGLTDVVSVAPGLDHACASKSDGTVWCWGRNLNGQLGVGDKINRTTPVHVPGLTDVVSVDTGNNITCAVKSDGTAWCWGYNGYGQLGDGTTTSKSTPVKVVGLTNAASIAVGEYHVCALKSDGIVGCWGYNGSGQLGDGSTANRSSIVLVSGLTNVESVAVGEYHTCAVKTDGTAFCWGHNGYGQLGDGTTTNRTTPVQVSGLTKATSVAVGYASACTLNSDGTVLCWGHNGYSQLGDGTTIDRPSPVPTLFPPSCPFGESYSCNGDPPACSRSGSCAVTFVCPEGYAYSASSGKCESDPINFFDVSLSGPDSVQTGQTAMYTISGSSDRGAVGFQITLPDGSSVDGGVADYSPQNGILAGVKEIMGRAYLVDAPDIYTTVTKSVRVYYPSPVISGIDCPDRGYLTQPVICTAVVSALMGTPRLQWSISDGGSSQDYQGNSLTATFQSSGRKTVTLNVSLDEDPGAAATASEEIDVSGPIRGVTIECPSSVWAQAQFQCSAAVDADYGTYTYVWSVTNGQVTGAAGAGATVKATAAGPAAVSVIARLAGADDSASAIANLEVKDIPRPKVSIVGESTPYVGMDATYQAAVACPQDTACVVEWYLDGTPMQSDGDGSAVLRFDDTGKAVLKVVARVVEAEDAPNGRVEASKLVYPRAVSNPMVSINGPLTAFVGDSLTLTSTVRALSVFGGYTGKWTLPDGNVVNGDVLTYIVKDGDTASAKVRFIYRAALNSMPEKATEKQYEVRVLRYVFPEPVLGVYGEPTGYAPYTVILRSRELVPRTSGVPYRLTYHWDYGDGSEPTEGSSSTAVHGYAQPGTYTATLTVSDERGNSKTSSQDISVLEAPPIMIGNFKTIYSNKYLKAPLVAIVKPLITGGNPKDRIVQHAWTVNDVPVGKNSVNLVHTFADPGEYSVGLKVVTKSGVTGQGNTTVSVAENRAPSCDLVTVDYPKYKMTRISVRCNDPDGFMKSYSWSASCDLEGVTVKPIGSSLYLTSPQSGSCDVTLTAKDDGGAEIVAAETVMMTR